MKRIISLCLLCALLFSLCACKEKEEKQKKLDVDIEYFATLGKIPECEVTLGQTASEVKALLDEKVNNSSDEEYSYDEIQGESNVLITDGSYDFYYKKSDSQSRIGYIVSYDDAYSFKIGTSILEVKDALSDFEVTEECATEENLFFYIGETENVTLIKTEFKKNVLLFVFEDNALSATVLYSSEIWK
ncbi:MAG: hypothetical protein ACOYJS_03205 [Acutalibacteraceae bacterium]|jgi:hypothetical protein